MTDILKKLEEKFNPKSWNGNESFSHFTHTGINLIDEINNLDPDLVIDVGCGPNRFKGHIKNLIGFDQEPFPFADIHMSIDDINFRSESADAVLALGSIQFGKSATVEKYLSKIISWVKPGGFIVMRVMNEKYLPLLTQSIKFQEIYFLWNKELIKYYTEYFNLELCNGPNTENVLDINGKIKISRISWWWKKSGNRQKYSINPLTCYISNR